jgi:proteasome lid subunit RPN8/RPN11
MRTHAASKAPQEACGLVAGRQGISAAVLPIQNVSSNPMQFRMDDKKLWDALQYFKRWGLDLLAIYHSHPNGPPVPSEIDLIQSTYPGVAHLVWTPKAASWTCQAFLLDNGRVAPIEFLHLSE